MTIEYYIFASAALKFTDRKTKDITIAIELPNSSDVIIISQSPDGEYADDVVSRKEFEKDYKPNKENTYFIYRLESQINKREHVFVFKLPYSKNKFAVILQEPDGEFELEYLSEKKVAYNFPLITKHHINRLVSHGTKG